MFKNNITKDSDFELKINYNLKPIGGEKSQIMLTATIEKRRVRIYTGLLIKPSHWLKRSKTQNECAREDSSLGAVELRLNKSINKRLAKILDYCNEYVIAVSTTDLTHTAIEHSAENFTRFIKSRIKGENEIADMSPLEFIKKIIKAKEKETNRTTNRTLSDGTVYNHRNALNRLERYCVCRNRRLVWELFNENFEKDFIAWMNDCNYKPNTIAGQFSKMKVWLKEAEKHGLVKDASYHQYNTRNVNVEEIYLNEEEIERLYNIDFKDDTVKKQIGKALDKDSHIEETRDLFIIACWTGLRFSDWHDLSNITINDEKINITAKKTNTALTIPMHPMVKDIIKKYEGRLPRSVDKKRTIAHMQLCGQLAGINSDVSRTYIKGGRTVTEIKPKYMLIKNHTSRRSFATNLYLRRIPSQTIMSMTGHTTEENFLKYIKVNKEQHAQIVLEEFNRCLINRC